MLAVVCKRTQQLPTLLGPAVHRRGKDTDHKDFVNSKETMFNALPYALYYGSNIVGLRFGDHRTKEILGIVGLKV